MYLTMQDIQRKTVAEPEPDITRPYGKFYLKDLFRVTANKPVMTIPTSKFTFVLDNNYWFDPDKEVSVGEFMDHHIRVNETDLQFPIIVLTDDNDVLDGVHRLVKAFANNIKTIKVRYITKQELMTINLK